jgi:hypothetical protein
VAARNPSPRRTTLADYERTGRQDCGNVYDSRDFIEEYRAGDRKRTAEQIVGAVWAQWESDPDFKAEWIDQNREDLEFHGPDPDKAYAAWRRGWMGCAVDPTAASIRDFVELTAEDNPNALPVVSANALPVKGPLYGALLAERGHLAARAQKVIDRSERPSGHRLRDEIIYDWSEMLELDYADPHGDPSEPYSMDGVDAGLAVGTLLVYDEHDAVVVGLGPEHHVRHLRASDITLEPFDRALVENPPNFTKKGERMYRHIKEGYAGDPRAKEIAARTVYASAAKGVPGLLRRPSRERR